MTWQSAASLPYPEENEFKISKAQLVNALSIVMKAVSTKTSSVILESILISASDNRVVLDATDTELSIQTEVDAVIVKAGGVVLNAKLFLKLSESSTVPNL